MLIGSACKDMMLVAVDGEGQNIKLCCCVRRVAADVSNEPLSVGAVGTWRPLRRDKQNRQMN